MTAKQRKYLEALGMELGVLSRNPRTGEIVWGHPEVVERVLGDLVWFTEHAISGRVPGQAYFEWAAGLDRRKASRVIDALLAARA